MNEPTEREIEKARGCDNCDVRETLFGTEIDKCRPCKYIGRVDLGGD